MEVKMDSRYSAYPAYKDSGVEWLGEIPKHWPSYRLKFFVHLPKEKLPEKPADCIYIGLENIESWTGRLLLEAPIESVESSVNVFKAGDVLFGKLRPYLAKVAYPDFDGVSTTEILTLAPKKELDGPFLFYLMRSEGFIKIIDSKTYGTKMPRANSEQIGNMTIPIPPIQEQRAIADFLDCETASIDTLIDKYQRLIELLEEKRTSLISQAVISGLDSSNPMKGTELSWVKEIPANWDIVRNGNLFEERDERNCPELPLLNVSIHTGVTLREFSTEHIEQVSSDWSTYKVARKGDIAFNKMRMWQGAVGVTPEDGLVSPDYTVARPRKNVNPRYFEYLFRIDLYKNEINRFSHGIVPDRNRLYWDQFKQMPSLCPPFEKQNEIVEYLDEETKEVQQLIQKIQKTIGLLQEYRSSLITSTVTGKLNLSG